MDVPLALVLGMARLPVPVELWFAPIVLVEIGAAGVLWIPDRQQPERLGIDPPRCALDQPHDFAEFHLGAQGGQSIGERRDRLRHGRVVSMAPAFGKAPLTVAAIAYKRL